MKSVVMFLGVVMMGLSAQAANGEPTGDQILDSMSRKFAYSRPVDLEAIKGEWLCGIRTLEGQAIVRSYNFLVRPAGIVNHRFVDGGMISYQDFTISNDGSLVSSTPFDSTWGDSDAEGNVVILRPTEDGQIIGQRGTNKRFGRGFNVNALIACEKSEQQ